jgi:hypothetical protein
MLCNKLSQEHKTWHETVTFIAPWCLQVRGLGVAALVSGSGSLTRLQSQGWTGKGLLPMSLTWLLAEFISSWTVGQRLLAVWTAL